MNTPRNTDREMTSVQVEIRESGKSKSEMHYAFNFHS